MGGKLVLNLAHRATLTQQEFLNGTNKVRDNAQNLTHGLALGSRGRVQRSVGLGDNYLLRVAENADIALGSHQRAGAPEGCLHILQYDCHRKEAAEGNAACGNGGSLSLGHRRFFIRAGLDIGLRACVEGNVTVIRSYIAIDKNACITYNDCDCQRDRQRTRVGHAGCLDIGCCFQGYCPVCQDRAGLSDVDFGVGYQNHNGQGDICGGQGGIACILPEGVDCLSRYAAGGIDNAIQNDMAAAYLDAERTDGTHYEKCLILGVGCGKNHRTICFYHRVGVDANFCFGDHVRKAQGHIHVQAHRFGNRIDNGSQVRIRVCRGHGNVFSVQVTVFQNDNLLALEQNIHGRSIQILDGDIIRNHLQIGHEQFLSIHTGNGQLLGCQINPLQDVIMKSLFGFIPVGLPFILGGQICFINFRRCFAGEIIGKVFHLGGIDLQLFAAVSHQLQAVFADSVFGILFEIAGQMEPVIAFAAVIFNGTGALGNVRVYLQHIVTGAGVHGYRALFRGLFPGIGQGYKIPSRAGADGNLRRLRRVAVGNIHSDGVILHGTIVGNLRVIDRDGLSLRQVQAGHDHIDVRDEDITVDNGITLGIAVVYCGFVNNVVLRLRLGIGVIRQDVQNEVLGNVVCAGSAVSYADISVILAGGNTDGDGGGILLNLAQGFGDRLLNGVVRFCNRGFDQGFSVSYHRAFRFLRHQAFLGYGNRLHGVSNNGCRFIRLLAGRNLCVCACAVVVCFRKRNRRSIIGKFSIFAFKIRRRIYLIFFLPGFHNFHNGGAAFRRCQRCGDIHIIRTNTQIRGRNFCDSGGRRAASRILTAGCRSAGREGAAFRCAAGRRTAASRCAAGRRTAAFCCAAGRRTAAFCCAAGRCTAVFLSLRKCGYRDAKRKNQIPNCQRKD